MSQQLDITLNDDDMKNSRIKIYRANELKCNNARYKTDPEYREKLKERSRERSKRINSERKNEIAELKAQIEFLKQSI